MARATLLGFGATVVYVYGGHCHGILAAAATAERFTVARLIYQNAETVRMAFFLGCV